MKKKKILLIDDSTLVLRAGKLLLEREGYDVVTRDQPVGTGAALMREKPDVVLLDVNMPALSGGELLLILREKHDLSDTIVLLHSSLPEKVLQDLVEQSGADGYICKSDDYNRLPKNIARWIEAKKASDSLVARSLFVDDDSMVLYAFRRMLGQEVDGEYVTSGEQALCRLMSSDPPSVVVVDLYMPGYTGIDLLREAEKISPEWKDRFVFVSGFADDPAFADDLREIDVPVVHKPVDRKQLLDVINSINQSNAAKA